MHELLRKHLVREEGVRLEPYLDSEGFWTIGIGHLIDNRKGGRLPAGVYSFPITLQQAYQTLETDVHIVETGLWRRIPWFQGLSDVRKVVLLSMAFQIGVFGLLKFRKTLQFVENGDFRAAGIEMLRSNWARQTAARANRLSIAMFANSEEDLT